MKQIIFFFKKLRLGQVLTVFLAGIALLLNTACSSGDLQGSRPDNTPVQIGGNNNPHKMGGEGSNAKMSTDPKVSSQPASKNQALVPSGQLIADGSIKSNGSDMIYSGSGVPETDTPDIGTRQQKSLPKLPLQKQPIVDRTNPDTKILERVGEAFKDATSFVKDTADSGSARPEAKANPAIGQ